MPVNPPSHAAAGTGPAAYNLSLTGEVLDGFDATQAQRWLAQLLKIPVANASGLLAGRSRCIKRAISAKEAARYRSMFEAKGVAVRLTKVSVQATAAAKAPANNSDTQVLDNRAFRGRMRLDAPAQYGASAMFIGSVGTALFCLLYGLLLLLCAWWGLSLLVSALLTAEPLSTGGFVLLHLLPAVLFAGLFSVLLRPFFAQQNHQRSALEIDLVKQARLVQFVGDIFEQVGAPAPAKILVNYDTQIVAEFCCPPFKPREGEVELTLGMPLIANLRTPQLAAFIAHEAAQMRNPLRAFVLGMCARVRHRFDDCASNQDPWSRRLEMANLEESGRIKGLLLSSLATASHYSAHLFRPLSLVLNRIGEWSNRFMVNDADYHAAALVGSKAFVDGFRQLAVTHHALHQAEERMFGQVGERQLVNNLPALVHHFAASLTVRDKRDIEDDMNRAETRRDYDYPSDRSRIIFIEDLDVQGLDCLDLAASDLFSTIGVLNEQVTLLYYGHMQVYFEPADLVDVNRLASMADKDLKREQLSAQYFNNWFDAEIFWKIPAPDSVKNLSNQERRSRLNELVAEIRHITPDYMQLIASEHKLFAALVGSSLAMQVRKSGYKVQASELKLTDAQAKDLVDYHNRNRTEYNALAMRLDHMQSVMGTRLFLAVSLHPDAAKRKVGIMFLQMLATLYNHYQRLEALRVKIGYLPMLAAREREKKETEHRKRIQRVTADVAQCGKEALNALEQFKCTFNSGYDTLAQFVAAHIKQNAILESPQPLESVAYFTEVCHGLAESNRMVNHQLAMIAMESELLNKITPVKLASA